jgi:cysteine desulfurase
MPAPIYLDYNATTPVAEDVLDAMLPFFRSHFGNPSSEHAFGWAADEAVEQARERTARLIGATPRALTFTSGATESISLALRGVGAVYGGRRHHVVTVRTEHKAVLETCAAMERDGFEVTYLPVDAQGQVDLDALRAAVTDKTLLVAAMWANNETGVLLPIPEMATIAHEAGALMMSDATQAVGKVPVHVERAGVDLLALSAHKMYGPKGVGALYVRRRGPRVRLQPQINGGSQEDGLRAGTVNVPGIVGLGAAAALARREQADDAERLAGLRDLFEARLLEALPIARINAADAPRLPNTSSVRFRGVRAAQLLPALRGVAASTGAACQIKTSTPSHVLAAMGLSAEASFSTVRFSLGRPTTAEMVEEAVGQIADAVHNVRHRLAA